MKVTLNPGLTINQNKIGNSKKMNNANMTSPVQNSQLPSYNQVDTNFKQYNLRQVSFSGAANEKLLKEIEQLLLEKKGLLAETADAVVKAAKERITRFTNWDDAAKKKVAESIASSNGTTAKQDYIRGHGSVWQWWNGDGTTQYNNAYSDTMNRHYWNERGEIQKIGQNIESDRKIVELDKSNAEQKTARKNEIEKAIEKMKRLISYQGLQDSINEMLSATGGIDEKIAGYVAEKNEINTKFVQLLAKSKDDPNTVVPPCVILYGPTGTGKTTFLNGIKEQSKEYAEVIDISKIMKNESFKTILDDLLAEAKTRYIDTKKRTVFLMNDAEKLFAINKTDAPALGIKLDDADINMLDEYGNNTKAISDFKSLLDDVSKIPQAGDHELDPKSASTFFITTNYPHLIHHDILFRPEKATKIPIGLASDYNLGEVLKFYFKKMNDVADQLKGYKHNPDYNEAIDGLAGITDKGRQNLKKMIKDGTIDKLQVDYNNFPYDKIAKSINPEKTKGAYSNVTLKTIAQEAFKDYLEKNAAEDDYRDSFFKVLINEKRDINPERYQKFKLIDMMLRNEKIDPDTLEQLLVQKKMGMLSEKKDNLLKYHIEKTKASLRGIEEQEAKGPLSEAQLKEKQELEKLKQKIDANEKSEPETPIDEDDI